MLKKVQTSIITNKPSRQDYFKSRYQNKQDWYKQYYLNRKKINKNAEKNKQSNYIKADNFTTTLKDLAENGINNVIELMKLREETDELINDYWLKAKRKENHLNKTPWTKYSDKDQEDYLKQIAREKLRESKRLNTLVLFR
jgi:hypothetical protein